MSAMRRRPAQLGLLAAPGADGPFKPSGQQNHEAMRAITQPWPTKDGRWVLPHFGLPNLQARC